MTRNERLIRGLYTAAKLLCAVMGTAGFGLILGAAGASDLADSLPVKGLVIQVLMGLGALLAAVGLSGRIDKDYYETRR